VSRPPPTVEALFAPELQALDRALAAATRTRARAYTLLAVLLAAGMASFVFFIDGLVRFMGWGGLLP